VKSAVELLRDATKAIYVKLHSHSVFATLQSGRIDPAEYIKLLLALHEFHVAFADVIGDGRLRCQFLTDDLLLMGVDVWNGGWRQAAWRIFSGIALLLLWDDIVRTMIKLGTFAR
jgi:hypothetical protein